MAFDTEQLASCTEYSTQFIQNIVILFKNANNE